MKNKIDPHTNPKNYETHETMGFDTDIVSREELLAWHKVWEPRGSGNLLAGRLGCTVIHLVAKLRGFAPFTQEEIANYSYMDARTLLISLGKMEDR